MAPKSTDRLNRGWGAWLVVALTCLLAGDSVGFDAPDKTPSETDDRTFRASVVIRQGDAQGSGTIIGSADDETLILTAAHVVEKSRPISVEFHRYNFGLEKTDSERGWPLRVRASVLARDRSLDAAVLSVRGLKAVPHRARVRPDEPPPRRGSPVTSIGVDLDSVFGGWDTRVTGLVRLELSESGIEHAFVTTERPPEFGRSGGGLFLSDGTLAAVCVGKVELTPGKKSGLYTPVSALKSLLRQSRYEFTSSKRRPRSRPEPKD